MARNLAGRPPGSSGDILSTNREAPPTPECPAIPAKKRREYEAYFFCGGFADLGYIECGRRTSGRLNEGRGISAIGLCAMPCRAQWPNALSQSDGTELFKCRKVAGYDGNSPSRMDAILSPDHAQYRFRQQRDQQRHCLHHESESRKIDAVNCIISWCCPPASTWRQ